MQAERALVAILVVAGCGDHKAASADATIEADAPPDATPDADDPPPVIVGLAPASGEANVALDTTIDIDFSEAIEPSSITASSLTVETGGVAIAGTRAVNGAHVRFTPAAALQLASTYTVKVTTTITDLTGHSLPSNAAWMFHTLHEHRVFITSVYGGGNLSTWADAGGQTGLAAADAICQARANAAALNGTFVAWLSSSTSDAYCRVQKLAGTRATNCGQATLPSAGGPWIRVDGVPWAGSLAQLASTSPRVYSPQLLNELGQAAPDYFFSNTNELGVANADGCGAWTNSTGGTGYGGARMSGTYWTQWGAWACYLSTPLLCLEVGSAPALTLPAVTGKRAFVTSTASTGNLSTSPDANGMTGVAAGDAICQARATVASLPNPTSFKAWLSTSTAAASTRITSNGPWQRVDGLPLASSKVDLLDGTLTRSLNVTETGAYVTGALVWTSTWRDGTALTLTCGDWTGSLGTAYVGRANDPRKWSYAEYAATCTTTQARLYCFED